MIVENQTILFDDFLSKSHKIPGIDCIYFLNNNYNIIKEHKNSSVSDNYLREIINIIKLNSLLNPPSSNIYSKPFHTYTLLNENGLIVISRLPGFFIVIIAGENTPVDLIGLLKICKEYRLNYEKTINQTL